MVTMFLFLGCSSGVDTNSVTTMNGMIAPVTNDSSFSGTHTLSTEGGLEIALKSPSLNLSSSKYKGKVVEVVGKYDKTGVLIVSTVSIPVDKECLTDNGDVSSECVDDSNSVGGQTYSDTDFGFSIKYADDWTFVNGSNITFYPPEYVDDSSDVDSIQVSKFEFQSDSGTNSLDVLTALFDRDFAEMGSVEDFLVKIGPDSLDALQIKNSESTSYYTYRNGEGLVYDISFVPSLTDSRTKNEVAFKQAVNSFKFLAYTVPVNNSESDVNLKESSMSEDKLLEDDSEYTYFESLPYHFSARYPTDWYYAGSFKSGTQILHHYGFSDESVTQDNELISMDVISGDIKKGTKLNIGNEAYRVSEPNGRVGIYVVVGDRHFHLTSPTKYESVMTSIASSITSSE